MKSKSQVIVLVKASPQPSKKHSETVCCAGVTTDGKWKRLFPIRYRRLSDDKSFVRWNIVDFEYSKPKDDKRLESCRVHEESIQVSGKVKNEVEKSRIVDSVLVASEKQAIAQGHSLALIRPENPAFSWRKLSEAEIESDRQKFNAEARQLSLLEDEISAYEPCPYKFTLRYNDHDGEHRKTCADWETSAAYFNLRKGYAEKKVLEHLRDTYCDKYASKGLVLSLGNMKRRPQTWQLLGLFPVQATEQKELF